MLLWALVEGPWHQKELNSDLGPCHLDYQWEQFVEGYCVCRSASVRQLGISKANNEELHNVLHTKSFHIWTHVSHVTHSDCIQRLWNCTLKGSTARAAVYSFLYSYDHIVSPNLPSVHTASGAGWDEQLFSTFVLPALFRGCFTWVTYWHSLNFASGTDLLILPRLSLFVSSSQTLINLPNCKARWY